MRSLLTLFLFSFALTQTIHNPFPGIFSNSMSETSKVAVGWSDEAKAIFYQTERISPEKALLYQLSMPFPFINLGYAYSDNWKRGTKMDILIAGLLLIGGVTSGDGDSECYEYCDEYGEWGDCVDWDYDCDYNNDSEGIGVVSFFGAGVLSLLKFVDVYMAAEEFNDNLYKRVFGGQRPYFSLKYNVKNNGPLLSLNIPLK